MPRRKPEAFLPLRSNWFHILVSLVDGEQLDRRFLERAAEAGERVAVVEDVEVAFVLPRSAGDVEARLRAGARESHVAPFL